jgi:RNA 2',3'-cyclic 3'-phosphodiesterase
VRLFAAVVPTADATDHLDRAASGVRAAHAELAWIPTERWHLTLAFYGEVADREVARVERRGLRATRGGSALDLRFAGAGHFGDRVLWVGVAGERDPLRALAGALATDARPYRPHLTVARARHGGDPRPAATKLAPYDGPTWRADEVVLFRSHLGPKPRHVALARWPLPSGYALWTPTHQVRGASGEPESTTVG